MSKHGLSHYLTVLWPLLALLGALLVADLSYAEAFKVQSLSLRSRVSEQTLLGKDATENFKAYDLSLNISLPWKTYSASGWGVATRVMASAGVFRGVGKNAVVSSIIPEFVLGSEDGRFVADVGLGRALFSRHRFGSQDFGGPMQFALTLGVSIPIYEPLGIGYRFHHYSDAGLNGPDTTGADLHMIELIYRQ